MNFFQWISQYSDQEITQPATKSAIETMISENANVAAVSASSAKSQDQLINEMMQRTNQDKDLCFFFLESVNWDLNQAIDMLNNLQTS